MMGQETTLLSPFVADGVDGRAVACGKTGKQQQTTNPRGDVVLRRDSKGPCSQSIDWGPAGGPGSEGWVRTRDRSTYKVW